MDNDTTIINVKNIRRPAWEAAKRSAAQSDDNMGTWLSDAMEDRINLLANRIAEPDKPALTADQLTARIAAIAELQKSEAAMKIAKVRIRRDGPLALTRLSLEQAIEHAEGLSRGKSQPQIRISGQEFGRSPTISDVPEPGAEMA